MKFHYFNQCDRWRTNYVNGEKNWQLMIANKKPITIEKFKERVDLSGLLDSDDPNDTLELFVSDDEKSGFYLSDIGGTKVIFFEKSGFEFIFTVDGEEPVLHQVESANTGPTF